MCKNRVAFCCLILVLAVGLPGVSVHARESADADNASQRFREAFAQVTDAVFPILERFSEQGEILVRVTKIAQSLDKPSPDQKALNEALSSMRDAEGQAARTGASEGLRAKLRLAVDQLRTELLNPGSTDMRRLSDELHHSTVHAASAENSRNIGSMREMLVSLLRLQNTLGGLASHLTADRPIPIERRALSAMRLFDPGNTVWVEFENYIHEISRIATRIARNREIAALAYGAMRDLDTFQNAIGLSKAREKLREAEGKFVHGDADPDLERAVAFSLQRVETSLLSPSSTDMVVLREELHHALVHPVTVVGLGDTLEMQRHLAVILDEGQRAARTAAEVGKAEAAAIARELPSMRQSPGQRP